MLAFSEFGRRVAENASAGTDHGTAGPVLLAGRRVNAGIIGTAPSLVDLEDGDLKWSIDFRRVYLTVLDGWLGIPSATALPGRFEPLPLLERSIAGAVINSSICEMISPTPRLTRRPTRKGITS